MARGDLTVFEEYSKQLGDKAHDFQSDVLKAGIVDATLTPLANIATPTWSDFSANEVSAAGGYVAGGLTLANVVYTEVDGVSKLDADDIAMIQDAGGFTDGFWVIIFNDTNGTKMAIAFVELAGPVSEVAGPLAINWNVGGMIIHTVTP